MAKISKETRKAIVASEINLRGTETDLNRVAASPDLKPNEAQKIRDAGQVILGLRLRREYPILGRVFEMLSSRLQDGKKVEPLKSDEVRGLLELVGQFSHAENEMINDLHSIGVISDKDFNTQVIPARDQSNTEQSHEFHKAPWAAGLVANNVGGMAMTFGALSLLGPLGMAVGTIGATAVSLSWAYGVQPKVQGALTDEMRARMDGMGMNALKNQEVSSEPALLTNRAAQGSVLLDSQNKAPLLDRVKAEVSMANLMVEARQASSDGAGPLDKMFLQAAIQYHQGLTDLLTQNETVPMSDAQLRNKIIGIRAQALSPAFLDSAAKQVLVNSVVVGGKSQRLAFLRVMGDQLGPQLLDALNKSKGGSTQELQGAAQSILFWASNFDAQNVPEFSDDLKKTLTSIADGNALSTEELSSLKTQLSDVKQSLVENEPYLKLDDSDAKDQAKLVLDTLWGTVVPNFETLDKTPEVKHLRAEEQSDGTYVVKGDFKSGALFGSEGSFSVKLDDLGAPDPASLQVDIGQKYVTAAAESGVKQQLSFLNDQGELSNTQITRDGAPPSTAYQLSGDIGGYSKYSRFSVQVSPMGMVDASSIKLS